MLIIAAILPELTVRLHGSSLPLIVHYTMRLAHYLSLSALPSNAQRPYDGKRAYPEKYNCASFAFPHVGVLCKRSGGMSQTALEVPTMDEASQCPLAETDDKFGEAHYFIERMMTEYHEPVQFRYNLNAFLQALRNVTFVLQKELSQRSGFREWYLEQQTVMKQDLLLRRFVEGRNIVVKQRSLEINSSAMVGFFRWRTLKLAISADVPAHLSSKYLVEHMAPLTDFIDAEHSAIGEQYGVRREWKAPELGDDNVVTLCDLAWVKIGNVLSEAHDFAGWHSLPPIEHGHKVEDCNVLLEMDLDPSLPRKWGWVE